MSTILETKPKPAVYIIEEKELFDLIIIGGGPAGLAAAIYALRARLKTLLIEKLVYGGQATTTFHIENYPGFPEAIPGPELIQKIVEQTTNLGLQTLWGEAKKISVNREHCTLEIDGKHLLAKAVIVATGCEPEKLNVPGEEKFRGRGVS
ncbi:MAG: NAD(P)/FAD-dependent oxidoreductase, partial [Candidatus Margulisiibacteriota bacterium]